MLAGTEGWVNGVEKLSIGANVILLDKASVFQEVQGNDYDCKRPKEA